MCRTGLSASAELVVSEWRHAVQWYVDILQCLVSMYVKLLVFFTLPVAQNNWQYESTEGKAYKNKYDI